MRRFMRLQIVRIIPLLLLLFDPIPKHSHLPPHLRKLIVQLTHHPIQLANELFEVGDLLFNFCHTVIHGQIVRKSCRTEAPAANR